MMCVVFNNFASGNAGNTSDAWHWGVEEDAAQSNWMNLTTSLEVKHFDEAIHPSKWLLEHTPDLNVALYINAAKAYEAMAKQEQDAVRKAEIQDSVMLIYDLRIKYFGDEANVLNRKGRLAYSYWINRKGKLDELHSLYSKIDELNGVNAYASNSYYLFKVSCKKMKKKELTEEAVLTLFDHVNTNLEQKLTLALANGKSVRSIEKNQTKIESTLNKYGLELSCEWITSHYGATFNTAPSLDLAKKISKNLKKQKCVSNPLFTSATTYILNIEPTAEGYSMLAAIQLNQKLDDDALASLQKAIELTELNSEKSEYYFDIAKIKAQKHQYNEARANARLALKEDASQKEIHSFIGDLYFSSYKSCKSDDVLQTRAVFIAAYKEYQKAGSASKMAKSKI